MHTKHAAYEAVYMHESQGASCACAPNTNRVIERAVEPQTVSEEFTTEPTQKHLCLANTDRLHKEHTH